ncbi:hypothetical protein NVP1177O_26 [Vibrio phage 1.177.O._10N.286.45.E10]|nr:hypothetical protein NVP1177O_26 [Vibrio phage 1.177.O._10N.286.45.E10]
MPNSKNKRKNGRTKNFNPKSKSCHRISGYDVYTQRDIDRNNRLAMIDMASKL